MKFMVLKSITAALVPVAAALALQAGAVGAQAAVISGNLSFTATGLPIDPIVGTVTFSFDDSAGFFNAANGATVNGAPVQVSLSGLSLAGSWTPVLTYLKDTVINGFPVQDVMAIGHSLNGTQTLMETDDWRIAFNTVSTGPSFREFTYTQSNVPGLQFQTFLGSVTAVPEPAAPALMGLGLALLIGVRRGLPRSGHAGPLQADPGRAI